MSTELDKVNLKLAPEKTPILLGDGSPHERDAREDIRQRNDRFKQAVGPLLENAEVFWQGGDLEGVSVLGVPRGNRTFFRQVLRKKLIRHQRECQALQQFGPREAFQALRLCMTQNQSISIAPSNLPRKRRVYPRNGQSNPRCAGAHYLQGTPSLSHSNPIQAGFVTHKTRRNGHPAE